MNERTRERDRSILETIVAHDGSCSWADDSVCDTCPLSKNHLDHKVVGCAEFVTGTVMAAQKFQSTDEAYMQVALSKLADMAMQDIIDSEKSDGT